MKRCAQGDLTGILDFYQLVINETEDMPVHARWVYGQHPTEEMITDYVRQGNMYCSEDGTDITAAVAITLCQTDDYHGIDWQALRAKYLPAARNAPCWKQFQRVMLQMLGELDTSHLNFSANDNARREWSLPKSRKVRAKRKVGDVEKTRARVHAATRDRWGYVRVAGMGEDDYNAFLVDIFREGGDRTGIILDLRGNTGGSWADAMLDSLMTPPHGWSDWQRGGVRGYPPDHLSAPHFSGQIVALIDEGTFSNGEMMAYALKTLKRATLVGRPTAGGVLSTFDYKVLRTTARNRTCAWTIPLPNGRAISTRSSRRPLKSSPSVTFRNSLCLSHPSGYEILTALCKSLLFSSCVSPRRGWLCPAGCSRLPHLSSAAN